MQYCVISAHDETLSSAIDALTKKVNRYLEEGWQPQGGLVIEQKGDYIFCLQSMIKP